MRATHAHCLKFKDGKTVIYEDNDKVHHIVLDPGLFMMWHNKLDEYKAVSFETLNIKYNTWRKKIGGKSCSRVKLTF